MGSSVHAPRSDCLLYSIHLLLVPVTGLTVKRSKRRKSGFQTAFLPPSIVHGALFRFLQGQLERLYSLSCCSKSLLKLGQLTTKISVITNQLPGEREVILSRKTFCMFGPLVGKLRIDSRHGRSYFKETGLRNKALNNLKFHTFMLMKRISKERLNVANRRNPEFKKRLLSKLKKKKRQKALQASIWNKKLRFSS